MFSSAEEPLKSYVVFFHGTVITVHFTQECGGALEAAEPQRLHSIPADVFERTQQSDTVWKQLSFQKHTLIRKNAGKESVTKVIETVMCRINMLSHTQQLLNHK